MMSSSIRHAVASFRFPGIMLLLLSAIGCVSTGTFDRKVAEADRLTNEVTRLVQERDELVRVKSELEERRTALAAAVAAMTEQLKKCEDDRKHAEEMLATAGDTLPATISDLRQQITELTGNNDSLKQDIDNLLKSRNARIRNISAAYDTLLGLMKDEIARGEATVAELKGLLTVTLFEPLLFNLGDVQLKQSAGPTLRKLAEYLKGAEEKAIRVEGFTETVLSASWPLQKYPTGWELAAARAVAVTRFLQNEGVSPLLLSAVAYGEYRPLSDNISELGRARNRRIQLVIVPKE